MVTGEQKQVSFSQLTASIKESIQGGNEIV